MSSDFVITGALCSASGGQDGGSGVFRIALGYLLKLAIAVAPFTIVPWWLKHQQLSPLLASFLGSTTEKAEKGTIAAFTVLDLTLLFLYEFKTHLVPRRDAQDFSERYIRTVLDQLEVSVREAKLAMRRDIR